MNSDKLMSLFNKGLFAAALALLGIAVAEKVCNGLGYTFLRPFHYEPSRLLEYASLFLIFVIAILLRQIREALVKP